VIHVVGPNYRAGQTDRALLTSCYARALAVADELGARSVAFPAVSAGIYGWPLADAARIAVTTVREADTQVEMARFVLFSAEILRAFEKV
jgi:O-acetyl-ADP-ribose deacetylase (regulator of RNase III)